MDESIRPFLRTKCLEAMKARISVVESDTTILRMKRETRVGFCAIASDPRNGIGTEGVPICFQGP